MLNRRHYKRSGDTFSQDNRCWYMSYLFKVNVTCATCFDHIIGHHQAPMNITPVIKINGHDSVRIRATDGCVASEYIFI
jgi:hypothetical protein